MGFFFEGCVRDLHPDPKLSIQSALPKIQFPGLNFNPFIPFLLAHQDVNSLCSHERKKVKIKQDIINLVSGWHIFRHNGRKFMIQCSSINEIIIVCLYDKNP